MSAVATTTSLSIPEQQLAARGAVYQAFSLLMSSPSLIEMDDDFYTNCADMLAAGSAALPFAFKAYSLSEKLTSLSDSEKTQLAADYGSYFEIGSDGKMFHLREEVATAVASSKPKEELIRFYEFFGYQLDEKFQWQADHLSLQLEFVRFLIEAMWSTEDGERQCSFLMGQRDFVQRHIANWLAQTSNNVKTALPEHLYSDILVSCTEFIEHDLQWLNTTTATLEVN